MSGRVSAPGDLDWDEARQAWNLAVDQRPAAVAIPHSADDVIAIVDFASERGLRVTAQGTGHNARAYDTLAGTILVKTQEMRGVEIDAEARVARVAAGTLWIEVTEPPQRSAWRRSPARRPTSASSATRSAAARRGSPASTGSPPTASSRSSS